MTHSTEELRAAVVADRKAGMKHTELMEKYDVARTTIKRWTKGVTPEVAIVPEVGPRPTYSPQKRRSILAEHYKSGRSINASADRYEIARSTLKRWVDNDQAWREDQDRVDMSRGRWALCPRRRIQVWDPAA